MSLHPSDDSMDDRMRMGNTSEAAETRTEFAGSLVELQKLHLSQSESLESLRKERLEAEAAVTAARRQAESSRRRRLGVLGVCTALEQEVDSLRDLINESIEGCTDDFISTQTIVLTISRFQKRNSSKMPAKCCSPIKDRRVSLPNGTISSPGPSLKRGGSTNSTAGNGCQTAI
jgi:hypothetical protein